MDYQSFLPFALSALLAFALAGAAAAEECSGTITAAEAMVWAA